MALSPEQFNDLIETYADKVVDNMSTKEMERLLYDLLVDSYSSRSENEMEELICATHGAEYYQELVEDAS